MRALLALLAVALLARPATANENVTVTTSESVRTSTEITAVTTTGAGEEHDRDPEQEDDSDSAPFMIVVEHGNGRRCGGSLVSLRTALTSAWCVRGTHGGDPRELWALAPAPPPARPVSRRVARVALAHGADAVQPPVAPEPAWGGAELDIAVLELEAPFGGGAHSRPILMATRPEDCESSAMCHVVRAVGPEPRLRIVDAELVAGTHCAALARGWPALRESALCLSGPTLCSSDRGAGVVCDGKLCGVLSRSARAGAALLNNRTLDAAEAAEALDDTCGDTHVAQSVARWRRFLHCAHTLRACGRGGECAQLCSERQLLLSPAASEASEAGGGVEPTVVAVPRAEPEAEPTDATEPPSPPSPPTPHTIDNFKTLTTPLEHTESSPTVSRSKQRTHTSPMPSVAPTHTSPPAATPPTAAVGASPVSPRLSFEFEPNRADFKAGEYGDNAAEYGGEESGALGGGPAPPSAAPAGSSAASPRPPQPAPTSPRMPRPAHRPRSRPRDASGSSKAATRVCPILISYIFVTLILYSM